ncbi:MAG: homocysteine S-methyltransferase family protein [Thermoguttaceae bacterium]|jgi:methionine synthase I (cobalamin-dependent)
MHSTISKLIAARPVVADGAWGTSGPVISDGAWGTQLQIRGMPLGSTPDAWNLVQPEKVEEVARAYVEAGSQVILTNTFGANRFILGRHGMGDKVAEVNRIGVEISKRAADGKAMVFASIGPSGIMLLMGDVSTDELQAAFAQQAQAQAAAGADGIVIETMSDLTEAKLALAAALETGLPVVASMTFDSGAKLDRTMMGVTPEQAAEQLTSAGADVIGANCGRGIADYAPICARLHAATDRPIWIKANAGLPKMVDGKTVYTQTPDEFASFVPQIVQSGAAFVGGCCGTTPEFIKAIRAKLSGN